MRTESEIKRLKDTMVAAVAQAQADGNFKAASMRSEIQLLEYVLGTWTPAETQIFEAQMDRIRGDLAKRGIDV